MSFTVDKQVGVSPLLVTFSVSATGITNPPYVVVIDFGDGTTSAPFNLANATDVIQFPHNYVVSGSNVTFTATGTITNSIAAEVELTPIEITVSDHAKDDTTYEGVIRHHDRYVKPASSSPLSTTSDTQLVTTDCPDDGFVFVIAPNIAPTESPALPLQGEVGCPLKAGLYWIFYVDMNQNIFSVESVSSVPTLRLFPSTAIPVVWQLNDSGEILLAGAPTTGWFESGSTAIGIGSPDSDWQFRSSTRGAPACEDDRFFLEHKWVFYGYLIALAAVLFLAIIVYFFFIRPAALAQRERVLKERGRVVTTGPAVVVG